MTVDEITPYQDYVLVKPDDYPHASESGLILLPRTATTYNPDWFPTGGQVVKVGPHVQEIPVGARVRFQRYEGTAIHLGEMERHFLMREGEIWGIES
jgi:co-chaperonin GroES (HSP10)